MSPANRTPDSVANNVFDPSLDATGVAEWSDALGTWSTGGISTAVIGDTATREQVRATLTVAPGAPRTFLRPGVDGNHPCDLSERSNHAARSPHRP